LRGDLLSITKKKISKDISSKIDITERESLDILEAFITDIKTMSQKKLMISNFGVFYIKTTKKRIGRNPKTKKEYDIFPSRKLSFIPSNYVKQYMN